MEDIRNKVLRFVQVALELAGELGWMMCREIYGCGVSLGRQICESAQRGCRMRSHETKERERSPAQALGDVQGGGRSGITRRVSREQNAHQESKSRRSWCMEGAGAFGSDSGVNAVL